MRANDAASDIWTDERIAILKQMWADGATAAAIAKCLGGLSRSAVLGKIHRLRRGAAARAVPPNKEPAGQLAHRPRSGQRVRHSLPKVSSPKRPSGKPPLPKPPSPELRPEELPRRSGKTLLELTNDSCRWPFGEPGAPDFFFCGEPDADFASGCPYCAHHARLAYSGATDSDDDDSCVIAVRCSPSIAPFDSQRRDAWRVPVKHPAPRWR